jgi:hypothetical protein
MSEFYDLLDEYLGDDDALTDIRVVVRRCWFYDFIGDPLYIWQGKGRLFTSDGREWIGTIDANDVDYHEAPPMQDARDGSSGSYSLALTLPDLPGQDVRETYDELKAEQWRISKRTVTCYLALFEEGEGLRPATPVVFFKELTMMAPKFSELLETNSDGVLQRKYKISILAKDANFGRSNTPNGTYADAIQKQRAKELGVATDKGSEFLASLANRTYRLP